jgi:hypothetical protein
MKAITTITGVNGTYRNYFQKHLDDTAGIHPVKELKKTAVLEPTHL